MSAKVVFPSKPRSWANQYVARRQEFARRVDQVRAQLYDLMKVKSNGAVHDMAERAWAVLLFAGGDKTDRDIASITGLSASCVRRVVHRFELYGLNGLTDPAPRLPRPAATNDQLA
jgi:hypothetical protein